MFLFFQDDYYETSPRHHSTLKPGGSHSCDECFKTFSSPGKLRQHEYTHTGETPFECKIPGKFAHLCSSMQLLSFKIICIQKMQNLNEL